MLDKIRERIANRISPESTEKLIEAITLLDLKLEDAEYNRLDRIVGDNELNVDNLKDIRRRSYIYWLKYPMVKQSVRLLTEFAFANGVDTPKSDNESAQEAINEFWEDKQNQKEVFGYQAQIEKSNDLQLNGEIFFAIFTDEQTKKQQVTSVDAGEITAIISDTENRRKILFYKREYYELEFDYMTGQYKTNPTKKTKYFKDWENVEALPVGMKAEEVSDGVIYHVKINCVRGKRGIPETYVILDWAKSHKKMNEDLATWTRAMATFAFKKKLKKGGAAIMAALKSTYQAKRDMSNPRPATASTMIENEYVDNTPMDFKTGAADWASNIRAMVLNISAGYGFGEQYYGNPSTANLAIGEKMELPLLKKIEGWQELWKGVYLSLINYALRDRTINAAEAEGKEEDYTIDIDFPPIVVLDMLRYIQALQIARQMGIITKEEAARRGLTVLGVNNIDEVAEEALQQPPDAPTAVGFGGGFGGQPADNAAQTTEAAVMATLAHLEKRIKEAAND